MRTRKTKPSTKTGYLSFPPLTGNICTRSPPKRYVHAFVPPFRSITLSIDQDLQPGRLNRHQPLLARATCRTAYWVHRLTKLTYVNRSPSGSSPAKRSSDSSWLVSSLDTRWDVLTGDLFAAMIPLPYRFWTCERVPLLFARARLGPDAPWRRKAMHRIQR